MEQDSPKANNSDWIKPKKLSKETFKLGEIIGKGRFSHVHVGKILKSNKYFAVKMIKKHELVKYHQVEYIFNEMMIMNNSKHPFIVKLEGYYQDNKLLCLVEEFINGGDLFTYLRALEKFELEPAKFYSAHIVLVFEFLHSSNIIYRDLKPENVLMDKGGYLKLFDFTFAKYCTTRTYTLCGTPNYLAPEILLNKGHGKAVDWWTLGVFIYELLVGIDPFADNDPMKVYKNILNGKVKFPVKFDLNAKKLIRNLIEVDLSRRYGNLKDGVDDIKNHEFFSSICFDKLIKMQLKPPYIPRIISEYDTSNCSTYPTSAKEISEIDEAQDPFLNW